MRGRGTGVRHALVAAVSSCAAIALLSAVAVYRPQGTADPRSKSLAPNSASVMAEFTDIGQQAGLTTPIANGGITKKKYLYEGTGSGIAFMDYDGDGYPDLLIVGGARPGELNSARSLYLYHNNRNDTFTDVTAGARLARGGWGQGICSGDFDNDGREDFFITYYGSQNVLYHNDGDGRFTDVTAAAGLVMNEREAQRNWSMGCAFLDYDHDGLLDLFVAGYVDQDPATIPLPGAGPNCTWKDVAVACGPRGLASGRNRLFHNEGGGHFRDVTVEAGISRAHACHGMGVLTADFENRGWTDIYVACDSTPSLLFHNKGNGTFTDVGVESGVAFDEDGREQAGMGVDAADYDGDGRLDIVKTNFEDDVPDLYRNLGDGRFAFMTFDASLGSNLRNLGWGVSFIDFDNDGWPDLFIANGQVYPEPETHGHPESAFRQRPLLYRNLGNGTFMNVTSTAGSGLQLRRSGRGVAVGDIDNDGAPDIAVNNQNDLPTLLHNVGGAHHWLTIRARGTRSNRDGIGARVVFRARGREWVTEVRSGGSYLSQSDQRIHIGLGDIALIDSIEVRWPSGTRDLARNVSADQFITLEEGVGWRVDRSRR